MNFNIELPEGTLMTNRNDLKEVLREMMKELQGEVFKDNIMTIQETAAYLKVSVPTIRALIAAKEVPYFQRGQMSFCRKNRLILKGLELLLLSPIALLKQWKWESLMQE